MISSPYEEEVPMRLTCCNLGHGGRLDWLGRRGILGEGRWLVVVRDRGRVVDRRDSSGP